MVLRPSIAHARRLTGLIAAVLMTGAAALHGAENEPQGEPAVQAIERVMPAVVSINTERVVQAKTPYERFYEQYYGNATGRGLTARPTVKSLGSGFIVSAEGYIVTNEHVVQRAADLKIWVTLSNKQTYEARYITGSTQYDLAYLKIDVPEALPFISLENPSPTLLGQTVLVLGNPLGFGSSVSRGILSGKERTVSVEGNTYHNLLQTDAAINPGNSGGPVIDLAGRLVGVSSVKMAQTPQGVPTQGMGFAIGADTVREKVAGFLRVAQGLPAKPKGGERDSRSWKYMGIALRDLTAEEREQLRITGERGVLVTSVDPVSPAADARFGEGLVIFQVGKYEVGSSRQIEELLEPVSAGSVIDLTIGLVRRGTRGNTQRQLQLVTLTAR